MTAAVSDTPTPSILPRKLGRYEVLRRLAVGGMAEIYLARQTGIQDFEKHVVIKRILPGFASDVQFTSMFLDEARLAATLQHPNIAQVFDIGADADSYFFAMEYVDGRDVRRIMQRALANRERVPLPVAIAIGMGAAAGLHAAHENTGADRKPLHIVHRDVSPANILLTFDGHTKLIDFGIAKAERRQTETQAGVVKGKYSYMSPEQCRNGELDRRSDIFSLGITLWELTTTSRLFRSKNDYQVMRMILQENIPPPTERVPDYPPDLEAVIMRALERDVDLRYQTARELYEDLESVAYTHGLVASPYVLSGYMRRLFPEEAEQSVYELDLQADQGEESSAQHVHRLSSPVLKHLPLRAPTAVPDHPRADSHSDTVISVPQTRIADAPTAPIERARTPSFRSPPLRPPLLPRWLLPAAGIAAIVWLIWLLTRL